jgi:acetyl esterase
MPLDPLVKAFLDQAAAMPRPKMWDMPLGAVRHSFAAFMAMVGPQGVPVGRIENSTFPGPAGPVRLRSYAPVGAGSEALPTLVYFHGGGFVVGDLDTHDGLCRLLVAEGGFRVVAVDYRLGPENKWPAPLEDAFAAIRHIFDNAAALGIDAGRIAVGGDSAGGHLAAAVTQRAREKGGPALAFQLLLFPGTEFTTDTSSMNKYAVGYFMEKQSIEWFYSQVLPKDADRNSPGVSPLKAADFAALPPAYVMLGGYDPLHDEGLAYAEKLRAAGVPVTIADYTEMVHCFVYLQTVLPQAHEAMSAAAQAVAKALENA